MSPIVTEAEVGPTDVLAIRFATADPLAGDHELVLRHRKAGHERRVRAQIPETAVPLTSLELTPGLWDAYLSGAAGEIRLISTDPGFSLDRLDSYALSSRTLGFHAYRTMDGYLALKVRKLLAMAEVRAVWLRERRFEVTGLLAYTGLSDDGVRRNARLIMQQRGSVSSVEVGATVEGVRFHAAMSLFGLLNPGSWEPSLEVDGLGTPLRLSARIDDVLSKRRRLQYPAATVDGMRIQPYYDTRDDLYVGVEA
ncbi:hypothetical protein [Rhizohabitans arisaemae]|uniref:hypothetical protein n=1 Tax=Rhizohabitans arisaemae TaxID=2720610 RepID=UPI0024B16FCE|nr:hypothetical protein [Rhizohabitans arisaemae]